MKIDDNFPTITRPLNIILAEDDTDDCHLFHKALKELPVTVNLTTVHDGDQLLELLIQTDNKLPDIIFLDLNMPRKNGYVTLGILKRDYVLFDIPVVIFSTVVEEVKIMQAFRDAAHYYIQKPNEFAELKKIIYKALTRISSQPNLASKKEDFILTGT